MTDPRNRYMYLIDGTRQDPRWWIEQFDLADAAAGVVRVDTRNPATMQRIANAIALHRSRFDEIVEDASICCARAALAALTEGEQ